MFPVLIYPSSIQNDAQHDCAACHCSTAVYPVCDDVLCDVLLSLPFLSSQGIYKAYAPTGSMTLQHFIIIFGAVQLLLSQLPNIHALRGLNMLSTLATLGFATVATAMSIATGRGMDRSAVSYVLGSDKQMVLMSAFAALGTIAFR
jgi:hypothetical protein